MAEHEHTHLEPYKVDLLMKFLQYLCAGPAEAYALMIAGHLELNEISFIDNPELKPDLETLISEIGVSMRSVTEISIQ